LPADDEAQLFRVRQPNQRRALVLKLYVGTATDDPAARDRLRRVGRLLAQFGHPNLLPIVDVDFHEGHPFVVMECIYSLTCIEYAEQRRPGPHEAAGLVADLASAVTYLDAQGIIDKDLAPSRVLIDETGRPRLTGFRLTGTRLAAFRQSDGSPPLSIADVSHETAIGPVTQFGNGHDVRCLGEILCKLVRWQPDQTILATIPQRAVDEHGRVSSHRDSPRLPRALKRICCKALGVHAKGQYRSVKELERALRRFRARRWLGAGMVIVALAFICLALLYRF
jgi:serine/threonine-protein kinase